MESLMLRWRLSLDSQWIHLVRRHSSFAISIFHTTGKLSFFSGATFSPFIITFQAHYHSQCVIKNHKMETFRNIFDPIWVNIFELWRITVIEISRMSIKCYLTARWKLRRSESNLIWRIEFFRLTTVTMMAGEMTWTSVWGTLESPAKTCEVIENLPWWVAGSLDRSRSKFHLVASNLTKIPHTTM